MKKTLTIILIVLLIAVVACYLIFRPCDSKKVAVAPTAEDYAVVNEIMKHGQWIRGTGSMGDHVVKVPATQELADIASRQKTVTFLSVENPAQYIEKGFVLINVISVDAMKTAGMDIEKNCNYRIFYGKASGMTDTYAVELCEK